MTASSLASTLGPLSIIQILDWFDGPRLFIAQDQVGTRYLCFWTDEFEDGDEWLYVPISDNRINQLLAGGVSLRSALSEPEVPSVFQVRTFADGSEPAKADILPATAIDATILPPPDDFLHGEAFADIPVPEDDATVTHRIRISKKRARKQPSFQGFISAVNDWVGLLGMIDGRPVILRNATSGSFSVDLQTEDARGLTQLLKMLSDALHEDGGSSKRQSLDIVKRTARLMKVVVEEKLTLEVRLLSRSPASEAPLLIGPAAAATIHANLRPLLSTSVDSHVIPQADDLHRVHRLIKLQASGEEDLAYHLRITPRQVNYYRQAARILGYTDEDNSLTSRGEYLSRLSSDEAMLRTSALGFESSQVGVAWLLWADVETIRELKADDAHSFLQRVAVGLSPTTVGRRAKTLGSWLPLLQRNHYLDRGSEP